MLRIFNTAPISVNPVGLDPISEQPSSAIVTWAPPAAGLVAAALVSWLRCPAPPRHLLSLRDLFAFAAAHVLVAFVVSAMGVLIVYAILARWADREVLGITLRTAIAAVWFAPLAVFVAETSSWALVTNVALVASVTRLLCSRRTLSGRSVLEAPVCSYSNEVFHLMSEPPLIGRLLPALCASVAVQVGAIASSIGYLLPAVALSGAGTAVITWRSSPIADWGDQPPRQSTRRTRGVVLTLAVATILTGGGLTRYLDVQRGLGWGGVGAPHKLASATRSILRSIFAEKKNQAEDSASNGNSDSAVRLGTTYPGIILLPEAQPYTTIMPPLPALHYGRPRLGRLNPLTIPFFGAYWFFKAPDSRPPPNSIRARGSPAEHTFTSTDHAPLFMEAHQDFGVLFDLNCCSAIQIAISNADRYIGSVSLELILINSRLPGRPAQSLGTARVESIPRWRPDDNGRPISETLTFTIPPVTAIRKFDQVTVRFRLAAVRSDTAAKTAIDRFLFIPR